MKGIKKCFGLFLVLATMLGLSLNASSGANALKYEITTIPYGFPRFNNLFNSANERGFGSKFGVSYFASESLDIFNKPYYYHMFLQDGDCVWAGDQYAGSIYHIDSGIDSGGSYYEVEFYFDYYDTTHFDYNFNQHESVVSCNTRGAIDNIKSTTFPSYVFGMPNFRSFPPYRYNYDGIYVHDLVTTDGLYRQSRFDFGELFTDNDDVLGWGIIPEHIKSVSLPTGLFDNISDVHYGSSVVISGSFMFDSANPATDVFILDQDFSVSASYSWPFYNGYSTPYLNGSSSITPISCSYNLIDNRSNTNEYPWELKFSCPLTLSSNGIMDLFQSYSFWQDRGVLDFNVQFNKGWEYPATVWALTDYYVITNGDDTPANVPFSSYEIEGNFTQDAPGSAQDDSTDSNVDWFSSLTNLFNFSFLNPFAPMFALFTDNSGCANIPIIAGMLHSEETTYCPWFSSTTRNTLTPVLGIVSTMLLFGFLVRWLGARSGNFIEDSGGIDSGGYHFENKYRRKK